MYQSLCTRAKSVQWAARVKNIASSALQCPGNTKGADVGLGFIPARYEYPTSIPKSKCWGSLVQFFQYRLLACVFFISILKCHLSRKMKPHDNWLVFCHIYVASKSLCLWNLSFHINFSFCKSTKRIQYIISLGPKNLSKPANTDRKQKGAIYQVVRDCPRVPHTRNGLGQFTVSRLLDQLWRIGR